MDGIIECSIKPLRDVILGNKVIKVFYDPNMSIENANKALDKFLKNKKCVENDKEVPMKFFMDFLIIHNSGITSCKKSEHPEIDASIMYLKNIELKDIDIVPTVQCIGNFNGKNTKLLEPSKFKIVDPYTVEFKYQNNWWGQG